MHDEARCSASSSSGSRRRRRTWASRSRSSASTTAAATTPCSGLVQKAARDPRVKVIALARNFGKEAALTAGIEAATGDMVVPIDADLQDPPELIAEFVTRWEAGLRRGLRRARRPLQRHGDEAHHGAALLPRLQPRLRSRHPRERRRLPADGPRGGGGAEAAAGAQPLHEGPLRLGGLPPDRRALRAARAGGRDHLDGLPAALALRRRRHHLVLDRPLEGLVADRPRRRVRRDRRGGRR